jgi:hypothetical protein
MADKFTTFTLQGKPLIQADLGLYPEASRLANGYWCPLGAEAGVAYVLMKQRDLSDIAGQWNSKLTLVLNDGNRAAFKGLYFVNAIAVSSGPDRNGDRIYLVKLADPRYLLKKFGGTVNAGYNYRSYVSLRDPSDTTTYLLAKDCFSQSLTGGTLWTWDGVINDLWTLLPTGAGAMPALPRIPDRKPENLLFVGESRWEVINNLLDSIDLAIKYDPIEDAFSIVDLLAEQPGLAPALRTNGLPRMDSAPYWGIAAHYPSSVVTHFPEGTTQYGSLSDTSLTANYLFAAEKKETKSTGKDGAVSSTKLDLFDEGQLRTDDYTFPLLNRSVDSEQRKDDWLARQNNSESYARLEYQGIATNILPGSQVKVVYWHNWGNGTRTEIARFPGMPTAQVMGNPLLGLNADGQPECRKWVDVARKTKPDFPHVMQMVKMQDGLPNSDGLYPASILRQGMSNGPAALQQDSMDACYLVFRDDGRWSDAKKVPRNAAMPVMARIIGSVKSKDSSDADSIRPVLIAEEYIESALLKKTSGVSKGSSGAFDVYKASDLSQVTGLTVTGTALGSAYTANKWAAGEFIQLDGAWVVSPIEC